jgi:DNA-binding transcriptional regulator YhcF (GntR family)
MKRSPAQEAAKAYLLDLVENCRRAGRARLPPVRALAAQARLSPTVVWRAVASLRDEGVLHTRRGGWIAVAGAVSDSESSSGHRPKGLKWERICAEIGKQILQGEYQAGAVLPGPKALAENYGVSYPTLRKALDELVHRGAIAEYRRGFRVPQIGGPRLNGSIVLVARGSPDDGPAQIGPRAQELLRLLEVECAKRRVGLDFLPYDYVNARLHPTSTARDLLGRGAKRAPILGFMVWSMGIQNPNRAQPDHLIALLRRILPSQAPIALLSETGERDEDAVRFAQGRMKVFSISNSPVSGEQMGRHLLNLGHRRIAFISPFGDAVWSRNRRAGLTGAYLKSSGENAVTAFEGSGGSAVVNPRQLYREMDVGLERFRAMCRDDTSGALRRLERAIQSTGNALTAAMLRETTRDSVSESLHRALSRPDITAWVGANDDVAIACLDFLAQAGRKVPDQISVAGFDDLAEASSRRITSYNFNCAGAVQAMMGHLLGSSMPRAGSRDHTPVEIEGYVVARRTTGKAVR